MARGGKRPGAGRPEGSKQGKSFRRTIETYFNESDIEEFFEFLKDNYKEDMRLMQWVGDHLLGKPQQSIDHKVTEMPTPILGTDEKEEPRDVV
jgi:hypothetical protein